MTADQQLILTIGFVFTIFPLAYVISGIRDIIAEKKERTRIQRILEGKDETT